MTHSAKVCGREYLNLQGKLNGQGQVVFKSSQLAPFLQGEVKTYQIKEAEAGGRPQTQEFECDDRTHSITLSTPNTGSRKIVIICKELKPGRFQRSITT